MWRPAGMAGAAARYAGPESGRGGCFAETDLVGGSSAVRICARCRGRLYRLPGLPLLPGGGSCARWRRTGASTTMPGPLLGERCGVLLPGQGVPDAGGASTTTSSPIWRRSTSAGGCSWRATACGVVPESRVYHLGGGTLQTDSPSKVFYNHRNNLAMLYKCSSSGQRLLVAVLRPALDLLAALSYLAQGRADNFRAVFRAWRDFSKWHPSLAKKKRRAIQSARASPKPDLSIAARSLRYLLGGRTFGRLM